MNRAEQCKKAFATTFIVLIIAVAVGYYCSYVGQNELQTANKCEKINFIFCTFVTVLKCSCGNCMFSVLPVAAKESKLKEMRRVGDLKKFDLSHFPFSELQVTGEGKEIATAGKETSLELSLFSQNALPLLFQLCKHLSCQLTDLHHQHTRCIITSTQPGGCTIKYTPTLHGPHQLRITIRDTDIPGSPFTVHVL